MGCLAATTQALPWHERPQRHEQDQRHHKRQEGRVEVGLAHAQRLAEGLRDQREESTEQHHRCARGQEQVVEHQRALTAYRGEAATGSELRRAPGEQAEGTDHGQPENAKNKDPPAGVDGKGVDGGQQPGAHHEGAQDRQHEGDHAEEQGPDPQRAGFLHHHQRVDERGTGQPRHEGEVLDRVPEPEPAPAQLVVSPPAAQRDPAGQPGPRQQGPRPHQPRPVPVRLATQQRGDGQREGQRKPDIAEVKQRRVQRQSDILQQGVQPPALRRRRQNALEGVRGENREGEKGQRYQRLHPQRVGYQRRTSAARLAPSAGQRQQAAKQAQNQHPQQDRALVVAPGPRDFIEQRLGAVAVFKGGFDTEVTGNEAGDQSDKRQADQTGTQHRRPPHRTGTQGFVEAQRCGGQEGEQELQPDQRQGQSQRQMRPLSNHCAALSPAASPCSRSSRGT